MDRFESDESAQIIVIAALLIAVLFVGLALVLNSAIYAENIATRGETSTSDAMAAGTVTEERLGHAIDAANYGVEEANYTQRRSRVRANATKWDGLIGEREAQMGGVFVAEPTTMTNGTRVNQSEVGNFMPNDDNLVDGLLDGTFGSTLDPLGITDRTSWLAADDVNTRSVEISVTDRTFLKEVDDDVDIHNLIQYILDGNDPFGMVFDDGTDQRGVYLVDHDDEITVVVTEENGGSNNVTGTCSMATNSATVDFDENAIVDGSDTVDCPELSFTNDLGVHDTYFVGSTNIEGRYNFIVDKEEGKFSSEMNNRYDNVVDDLLDSLSGIISCAISLDPLCLLNDNGSDVYGDGPSNGDPYTTTSIYDATIETTYNDGRITYTRNVTYPPTAR